MKKDQGNGGKLNLALAATTEEFRITLKKTRPLHIRPFGTVFLMYVGVN
jgi:hypothetical protein